jgi:hypothetical protein
VSGSSRALAKYGKPSLQKNRKLITKHWVPNGQTPTKWSESFNARLEVGWAFAADVHRVGTLLGEWPLEIESYNERLIAGTQTPSMHSWGIAFDVFGQALGDPKSSRKTMSRKWCLAMEELGWRWGGRWKSPDPHHFEEIL